MASIEILALARVEFQTALDSRSKIPEYIGCQETSPFVFTSGHALAREIATFGESDGREKIWEEIILDSEIPAYSPWSIKLPYFIGIGDEIVVADLEVTAETFEPLASADIAVESELRDGMTHGRDKQTPAELIEILTFYEIAIGQSAGYT